MAVFTTNWNLYRTHFKPTVHDRKNIGYSRNRLSKAEEEELLKSLVEQLRDL